MIDVFIQFNVRCEVLIFVLLCFFVFQKGSSQLSPPSRENGILGPSFEREYVLLELLMLRRGIMLTRVFGFPKRYLRSPELGYLSLSGPAMCRSR